MLSKVNRHLINALRYNAKTMLMPIRNSSQLSTAPVFKKKKTTLQTLDRLYQKKVPIAMMTAHDYPSGCVVENSDMDICLVGDSLAMVALGYENTNEITFDEMMHHSRAVARGCKSPFLIGDMPFGSYEKNADHALENAIRYVREGKVEGVKLEGGIEVVNQVRKIVDAGIPVMGHVGLTPQKQAILGGYKVQGKTLEKAMKMYSDAMALQEAGAFCIVLEAVPEMVATFITKKLSVPTIGIGAGPGTSGQVLVYLDTMGMFDRFVPKFCKVYAKVGHVMEDALKTYKKEVIAREFPDSSQHTYKMESVEEEERLRNWMVEIENSDRPSV